MHEDLIQQAASAIRTKAGDGFEIALVLGSGLGELAGQITDAVHIPYADIPGFPVLGVSSHAGELIAGLLGGRKVLLFAGRVHYYEDGDASAMALPIDVCKALGCHSLILTNAAGSLHTDMPPGEIALITDHINFSGLNPLIGYQGDERFVDLTDAYDPEMCALAKRVADAHNIALKASIYMWFSGPSFETPAEVRAAGILGADLVGMSTVPEAILARHRGLRVAAFSVVTNFAAGKSADSLNHGDIKLLAREGADKLIAILPEILKEM